ncbi:hypothetical protein [Paraburkholderia sp. J7]|uniref:hypothetical protein n=1 Tax=Paraburkholderia sp. J7 TaxID=2805438 RepID=UPI002AB6CCFF|nr:hypothetical protein [Paraburkholderia sp. J7]
MNHDPWLWGGGIIRLKFPDQVQLAQATWRYLERRIRRFGRGRAHHRRPAMLLVPPTLLPELLMALDAPDADLRLLENITVQIDERRSRPCLVGRHGRIDVL